MTLPNLPKMKERSVAWRIGVLVLLGFASTAILGHFSSEVETGIAMKLGPKVCISRGVPNGRDVGCWRTDDNTDIDPGIKQGDLVTVRHHGDVAMSVDEDQP